MKLSIQGLIKKIELYKKADAVLLRRAYDFALTSHKDERRKSGEPYIEHPLQVAYLLADLHLDEKAISAGLLHDVIENTPVTFKELERTFGNEVALLVEGVTKISKIRKDKRTLDNENIIKVLLASTKDVRVLLIKLADRLHNIRTLSALDPERQQVIAKITLEVYAPIAYRLGLYSLKNELEDGSFKILQTKEYLKIRKALQASEKQRIALMQELQKKLESALQERNIHAHVYGRAKHLYSIYRKREHKHIDVQDMNDLIGLRVIVESVQECYDVLGIVHSLWKPVPGRLKDMIALPKSNMYQSLHTGVIGDTGTIFEVQIRTGDMHKLAEDGIAAHWKYKGLESDVIFDKKVSWLKEITEFQREENPQEFMENLKVDFFSDEIYVFTPKGKVIPLPVGCTILDFAYHVHSDIGNKSIGAKVNGRFVGLHHELNNGDIVEVLTSKQQKPHQDWLKYVRTFKARNKIRKELHLQGATLPTGKVLEKRGDFSSLISLKNIRDKIIRPATCCDPLPGDKCLGNSQKGEFFIHKQECKFRKGQGIKVEWLERFDLILTLTVLAEDRVGLMADLFSTFSKAGINLKKTGAKTLGSSLAEGFFEIHVTELSMLTPLLEKIKEVKGVKKVRIEV